MEVFTKRRVLVIKLASGQLGSEAAQLLGALLLSRLWLTIGRRSQIEPECRHPVFVYLDEFQQLLRLPLDLGDALVQARGLGVGLVLAHQHLGQLNPAFKTGVLANAGSRIAFTLRRDDATVMAKELGGGLTPEDLQGLGPYETYQALWHPDGPTRPASARTLPLEPSLGSAAAVMEHSAQTWGRPRAAVDEALLTRRGVEPREAPIGARRRGGSS
jgi:hypothetical protein